jgi:hypothetical protein
MAAQPPTGRRPRRAALTDEPRRRLAERDDLSPATREHLASAVEVGEHMLARSDGDGAPTDT